VNTCDIDSTDSFVKSCQIDIRDANRMHVSSMRIRSYINGIICTLLGNIAVGKSTIMSHIAATYCKNLVRVHQEPVEHWMNIKGFDLLQALYAESHRWTFTFEMSALLSRMKLTQHAAHRIVHVYERSILSCFHVFIRHDRAMNYINEIEYRILREHFQYGLNTSIDLSSTIMFYLNLSPDMCLKRIIERSRHSEVTIDLKRLEQIQINYERFLGNFQQCPVRILDASQTRDQLCQQIDHFLKPLIENNQTTTNMSSSMDHADN
jgi:deoxyadenosine/deoxycytidine kinase